MNPVLEKRRSCFACIRNLLIVANCFLMLLGIAIAGVFIWMAIDQVGPVKGVTGNDLAMVSVCLLVSAGILLVFSTCIGITAASVENYLLTVVYIVLITLILLLFAAASVCVAVFKTMLTEPVKLDMEESIRKTYGSYLDNSWNRRVTEDWNNAQLKWQCCAAADKSWAIYQESTWYAINTGGANHVRPWVPESCCERLENGEMKDKSACLYTRPPEIGDQYAGIPAPVYQRGCYETLKDYFRDDELSWFTGIFWVGIAGIILMLSLLVLAISFGVQVKRESKLERLRSSDFEFLSKPSVHSHLILNSPPPQPSPFDNSLSLRETAPNQYMYSMA